MCSIHTSVHSVFGQFRLSDKFGFRISYDFGHCAILFYLDQIRNFYYFLVKTCFHHNICHHHKHKKFFKISFLALRGNTCKTGRRLQLRGKMNCQKCRAKAWATEQLTWNNLDSHWPVPVDWAGGLFVKAQSLRLVQVSNCHFTIIISWVQSTLRNIRHSVRWNSVFG